MFGLSDSITGTLLGASITLIGLIVSKEGRVSEFRQAWIDKLREDVAAFIEIVTKLEFQKSPEGKLDVEKLANANLIMARIRLRLNPSEPESRLLLDALHKASQSISNYKPVSDEIHQLRLTEISASTQVVLSMEWKRVKRGEPVYRAVFYLCLLIVIAAMLAGCLKYIAYHLSR